MKVVLDLRTCNCWDAACEAHFGSHYVRDEITPVDCMVEMVDDGQKELTFFIKDRDGSDKTLVVNEENRADVYDAWRKVLDNQPEV